MDGRKVRGYEAFRLIAGIAVDAPKIKAFSAPCDCTGGICLEVPNGPVRGHKWSRCPTGELRNPMWQAAVYYSHAAEISPLSGWPDSFSAGVVDAVMALRQARSEHEAQQARERAAALERG